MSIEVGSIVEGIVTGITNFGVFVQLSGGEVGLVHISEIADTYVKDINEFLTKKDRVKVKVLSVDQGGKIGLSIKQANPTAPAPRQQTARPAKPERFERRDRGDRRKPAPPRGQKQGFEDKMTKFLKESDERLHDLKKNTENKRGGRGNYRQETGGS